MSVIVRIGETGGQPSAQQVLIDDVDNSTFYLGRSVRGSATSDAVWRILKIVEDSGGDVFFQYANGTIAFDKVWDDRATYAYS